MLKIISILIGAVVIASGCESTGSKLVIYNSNWPDGTCISIIDGNNRLIRTSLYGGRTQLNIKKISSYVIRASSPAHITFLSDTLSVDSDHITFVLPPPTLRHKIDSWRIGFSFRNDLPDSVYNHLVANVQTSLTTISPELLNNKHLIRFIRTAHAKGIEVTACVDITTDDLYDFHSLADSAEVYCVDGIVVQADSAVLSMPEFGDVMRGLAAVLHRRGLTFGLQITTNCGTDSLFPLSGIRHIMTEAPAPERPDELRIAFKCTGLPSSVPVDQIEKIIEKLFRQHIPLSHISIELTLTAFKFRVVENGVLEPLELNEGELQTLLNSTDGHGIIRLRDLSLRLGHKGALYAFDDIEGTAQKIGLLRAGGFLRSGGIHIVYDGLGVEPDQEDFKLIIKSAGIQ